MNSTLLRWTGFALGVAGAAMMARGPLMALGQLSSRDEMYSHLPLIPAVAAYFFWSRRKAVASQVAWSPWAGILLGLVGLILYRISVGEAVGLQPQDRISLSVFSTVILVQGVFLFFFGARAARKAAFPLLFLFFVVPLPTLVQDWVISLLQRGSAEATHLIFAMSWVPFFRDGFVFQVPGISVEVAPQCGGIRSGIALVITSVVAGEIFLSRGWSRILLVVASIPITIFKNGLRIVGLTLGAMYVDPRILDSELHRSGGIPFFGLALAMMAPVVWALYKAEGRSRSSSEQGEKGPTASASQEAAGEPLQPAGAREGAFGKANPMPGCKGPRGTEGN